MTNDRTIELVSSAEGTERLDSIIPELLKKEGIELTRSRVKQLIKSGYVEVNGAPVRKPASSVPLNATIVLRLPEEESTLESYDLELDILFEDAAVLVINKPAGLTMHPGAGNVNRTLANAVQKYITDSIEKFPGGRRPGIVHRLDKDTTGVIVIARTAAAHAALSEQFANRTIERRYLSLLAVTPRANRLVQRERSGTIETLIGRHPMDRKKQAVVETGGKRAVTHWKTLELFPYAALMELKLETGRTHQIRVHMESIRSPVLGDRTYGSVDYLPKELDVEVRAFGRQALHAAFLAFEHPESGERLQFETQPPEDMQKLMQLFKEFSD